MEVLLCTSFFSSLSHATPSLSLSFIISLSHSLPLSPIYNPSNSFSPFHSFFRLSLTQFFKVLFFPSCFLFHSFSPRLSFHFTHSLSFSLSITRLYPFCLSLTISLPFICFFHPLSLRLSLVFLLSQPPSFLLQLKCLFDVYRIPKI